MMRKINEIIIHCSATKPSVDIGVKEIKNWHVNNNGWADIGYHYVVRLNGYIEHGRAEWRQGAHCLGHNKHSIGICYVGGLNQNGQPSDTRTGAQKRALLQLLKELEQKYRCEIHGHGEFAKKDCPCFDAYNEYKDLWQKPEIQNPFPDFDQAQGTPVIKSKTPK